MLKRMGAFKAIEREELHKLDECEATKTIDENGRTAPWREELRKAIKAKDRANIERCKMNELDPEYRSHSRKEEVNQGLTKEQAVTEAQRCLIVPTRLYDRLSGRYRYSPFHQEHRTWRNS